METDVLTVTQLVSKLMYFLWSTWLEYTFPGLHLELLTKCGIVIKHLNNHTRWFLWPNKVWISCCTNLPSQRYPTCQNIPTVNIAQQIWGKKTLNISITISIISFPLHSFIHPLHFMNNKNMFMSCQFSLKHPFLQISPGKTPLSKNSEVHSGGLLGWSISF